MDWPQFPRLSLWPGMAPALDSPAPLPMAGSHYPLPGWPAQDTLEYFTKLILLGLLLLALPYVIGKLLTRPGDLLDQAGKRAMRRF